MASSFEQRFVFGLFVLCVFNLFFVGAVLRSSKTRTRVSSSSTRQQILSRVPQISETFESQRLHAAFSGHSLEAHRLHPAFSSQTSINSMTNVNLRSRSSSPSAAIHRTASSPSLLNTANSPSIMRETSVLHRHAASVLNPIRSQQIIQPHRMLPNFDKIKPMGKYLKNGAIVVAGTGGAITIVKSIKGDEHSDEKIELKEKVDKENKEWKEKVDTENKTMDGKTITARPEYYNPLGSKYR